MRRLVLFVFFISLGSLSQSKGQNYSDAEQENWEAIAKIHSHLDDNGNGDVDIEESAEFIQGELKITDGEDRYYSHFHGNDKHISLEDLWMSWKASAVYNWTNNDVVDWLVDCVLLPDYKQGFIVSGINGSKLPRLAAQDNVLLQNDLGVKDVKHRKKIALRAMDIVLFGPPPTGHNFIKDIVLAFSVFIATAGCWFAVVQKRRAKVQMDQIMRDMKVLQQAEENLQELQNRLNQAEIDHQNALEDKVNLEARLEEELQASKQESDQQDREGTDHHLQTKLRLAEEELAQVHRALRKAEKDLECQSWRAPALLRQWLQLTYEKETKHFQHKRTVALKQMLEAKDACERIKRKRTSMFGSFRLAHDLSIDEVDQKILSARTALAEVTNELEERQHRWSQIESLCGMQIVSRCSTKDFADAPMGSRHRTNSAIARALANVANIGGVGSGRKISSSDSPWMVSSQGHSSGEQDLPPTYSSTIASVNSTSSHLPHTPSVNVTTTKTSRKNASVQLPNSPSGNINSFSSILNDLEATAGQGSTVKGSGVAAATALVVNGEHADSTSLQSFSETFVENQASTSNSPVSAKSKKKLSWFSSGKKDVLGESDSSNIENDEENRRKKVKWLWRSAVRKSSVHKMQQNGVAKADGKPKPSSSEKLKAG